MPPSALLSRLYRVSRASDIDLHDIVRFLEADPSLAQRVLHVCNHLRKTGQDDLPDILSIRRAVVMLGLGPVREAVLAICMHESIETARERAEHRALHDREESAKPQRSGFVRSDLDWAGLWRHTVAVACAAEQLTMALPRLGCSSSRAFVLGLMSNAGKFALDIVLPDSYTRVLALARLRLTQAAVAEREVFGVDNIRATAQMCSRWSLPLADAAVLEQLGTPEASESGETIEPMASLLRCATMLARSCHLGFSGDYDSVVDVAKTYRFLGVSRRLCEDVAARLPVLVADRAALIGIEQATDTQLMIDAVGRANREIASQCQTIDAHADHAQRAMMVLASITRTIERSSSTPDIHVVARSILDAADVLFGPNDHLLFVRPTCNNAWIVLRRNTDESTCDARPVHSCVIEVKHPHSQRDTTGWIELADPSMLGKLPVKAVPWLSDMLDPQARRASRVMPLVFDTDTGCCALLVHRDAFDDAAKRVELLRTLSAVWGSRIIAWSQMQRIRSQATHSATSMLEVTSLQDAVRTQSTLVQIGRDTAAVMEQVEMPVSVIAYRADQLANATNDVHVESVARTICAAANEVSAVLELLRERAKKCDGSTLFDVASASVALQHRDRTTHTN